MEGNNFENRKEVPLWIGIVGLILIIAAIICDCNELRNAVTDTPGVIATLDYVATMLALMFAALYFMMGFKKDAATYYKLFVWAYAAATAILVLRLRDMAIVFVIIALLNYGILAVIAVGKDLGKKRSFALCITGIVLTVALISLYICMNGSDSISTMLSKLLLSVLLFVMVNAKYADKEIRGTK